MLLAVMQTTPPVPRKTPDQSTQASSNPQRNTKGKQETSQQTVPVPPASKGYEKESQKQGQTNAREPVIIREPAPVSRKDAWDKAYVIATICLVFVGGLGVRYALMTLKEIRKQVGEMSAQRDVMNGQLKSMQDQLSEMGEQTDAIKNSVAVAKESADAAKANADAALRGVKLQEAHLRQWVTTDNWRLLAPSIPLTQRRSKCI